MSALLDVILKTKGPLLSTTCLPCMPQRFMRILKRFPFFLIEDSSWDGMNAQSPDWMIARGLESVGHRGRHGVTGGCLPTLWASGGRMSKGYDNYPKFIVRTGNRQVLTSQM